MKPGPARRGVTRDSDLDLTHLTDPFLLYSSERGGGAALSFDHAWYYASIDHKPFLFDINCPIDVEHASSFFSIV
jgi:hypothetical protein